MSSNPIPLTERVASCFSKLSTVAKDLNTVSDELGKSINEIDAALKKLNLGVPAWVKIRSSGIDPEHNDFWDETDFVGYCKINGKWGISLRTVGDDLQNHNQTCDEWLFTDAPRALRLAAIDKIPDLFEAMIQAAVETRENIDARLGDVRAVASAVKQAQAPAWTPDPPKRVIAVEKTEKKS